MSTHKFKLGDVVRLKDGYWFGLRIVGFTIGGDVIVISDIQGLATVRPDEIEIVPPAQKGKDPNDRTAETS